MKPYTFVSVKSQSCLCSLFITASFIFGVYFINSEWFRKDIFMVQVSPGVGTNAKSVKYQLSTILNIKVNDTQASAQAKKCNDKCRPVGSEALPRGIVSSTSNLEMIPLSGPVSEDNESKKMKSLLGVPVGVKQKKMVNEIVKKFLELDSAVMLFHYDGMVDEWHDLEWSNRVIHISAVNQTKWWFAKRFLHPDIVSEYEYIFLWDEDLGVENFHPRRYISIIKEEGFEISQPALDLRKSKVHHRITVRNRRIRVHRRFYKAGRCDGNSTVPPCVGWVEMMAPVFSRAAWRCVWHMIQNDLIHAWGLDMQLGYCSQLQGDRTVKVGVVDEEYIAHLGLPTLGSNLDNNMGSSAEPSGRLALSESDKSSDSTPHDFDNRSAIRLRSYAEMSEFGKRWKNAVKEDECWVDPFRQKDPN